MPYPNVYEPRPKREAKPLSDDEQKKLESELTELRDEPEPARRPRRQPPPPPAKAAAPAKKDRAPRAKSRSHEARPRRAKKKQNDAIGARAERAGCGAEADQLTPAIGVNP